MQIPVALSAPHAARFDAVGFGLNMTDILAVVSTFPTPGTKQPLSDLVVRPGGQAATAMTACRRLGWRTRYVGCFGDDSHGRTGLASLREAGVDVEATTIVPGAANGVSVILVDQSTGERTVMWSRDPRLRQDPARVSAVAVASGRVLLVDCHDTPASTIAARYARERGVPTVVDVEHVRSGVEGLLEQIDVIITAQAFPTDFTGIAPLGAALRALYDRFRPALVCATMGSEGSLTLVGAREIWTPAFPVRAVDTTGAGDVFRGGFIAGWLRAGEKAEIELVLRYANATAALKCRALGARDGIPTREQVDRLLATGRADLG